MLEFAGQEPPSSEAIGLLVAIIILLVAFGSIVAAGMPIVVALVGLTMGQMLVLVVANFLDVATFAPTLAAMIGLGVGIDYALFVMNRYRQALLHGREPKDAAMESVKTAGRAVLFAGSTVIIALLGLFVLGINFFNGLAVAAAVTVLMVMLSALWMLPALLSLLGAKALAWRLPWGKKPGALKGHPEGRAWAHYGRILQRKPIIPALLALAIVVILAIPMLSLRQGFADDSGKPEGSPARIAYDLRAEGFGPGVNGPFLVVADLSEATSPEAYGQIIAGLAATEGVAGTSPSAEVLPILGQAVPGGGGERPGRGRGRAADRPGDRRLPDHLPAGRRPRRSCSSGCAPRRIPRCRSRREPSSTSAERRRSPATSRRCCRTPCRCSSRSSSAWASSPSSCSSTPSWCR